MASTPVFGQGLDVPTTWSQPTASKKKPKKKAKRPWYQPRIAFGLGMNLPEIVALESQALFGRYFSLRVFYTPPLPFRVRVEMPADIISTKKQVGVANPDFTVRFKGTYGAHYGADLRVFPLGGSFFLGGGASIRTLSLRGDTRSAILICSLIEAAKEPPCGNEDASIRTETELVIGAETKTTATLARASLGWLWHVGKTSYLSLEAGITKPYKINRNVSVTTDVDAPGDSDEDLRGALAEVKKEREADLREKAIKEMQPVEEKPLPILGLVFGFRL